LRDILDGIDMIVKFVRGMDLEAMSKRCGTRSWTIFRRSGLGRARADAASGKPQGSGAGLKGPRLRRRAGRERHRKFAPIHFTISS
jgi:hypothetical protein